jgi:hypothetical protein
MPDKSEMTDSENEEIKANSDEEEDLVNQELENLKNDDSPSASPSPQAQVSKQTQFRTRRPTHKQQLRYKHDINTTQLSLNTVELYWVNQAQRGLAHNSPTSGYDIRCRWQVVCLIYPGTTGQF